MSIRYKPFVDWLDERGMTHEHWKGLPAADNGSYVRAWLAEKGTDDLTTAERIGRHLVEGPDDEGRFLVIAPRAIPSGAAIAELMTAQSEGAKACREALREGKLAARNLPSAGVWQHPGVDIITAEELHIPVDCGGDFPPEDNAGAQPRTDEGEDPRDAWDDASAVVCYLVLGFGVAVFGWFAYRAGWEYWAKFVGGLWPW